MAATVAKLVTKVGLGAGAIYVTKEQGVWGTSEEGSKAAKKVSTLLSDRFAHVQEVVPKSNLTTSEFGVSWNNGVKTVFGFISDSPELATKYSKMAVSSSADFVRNNLKS